jgi:hypothetical protein
MNKEFHYYILYFLCNKAGIQERDAYIISYSSQYVDNNVVTHNVKTAKGVYKTTVTQNYAWLGDWFPKNVYIPFHFLPGDVKKTETRKDGKTNEYNVTPDSANANALLEKAFETKDLYRIGISLHTYADTWAHQNFTGLNEKWNAVKDTIMPDVGHAEVYSEPDRVNHIWNDTRLVNSRVDNNARFLSASEAIYKKLCKYNGKDSSDVELVVSQVEDIFGGHGDNRAPDERIYDCIINHDIMEYDKFEWLKNAVYYYDDYFTSEELREFDTFEWIKDAILYQSSFLKRPVLEPREGFYESNFYLWHEAAKKHLEAVREILNGMI